MHPTNLDTVYLPFWPRMGRAVSMFSRPAKISTFCLELINFDIDTVMSDALKALFSALTESITDPQWIGIKKHYLCIYIESGKAVCEPFMNNQLVKIFKMPVSE